MCPLGVCHESRMVKTTEVGTPLVSSDMKFDPRKQPDHAKKVFDEILSQSSIEHGSKSATRQIHQIIVEACDGKVHKVPAPV